MIGSHGCPGLARPAGTDEGLARVQVNQCCLDHSNPGSTLTYTLHMADLPLRQRPTHDAAQGVPLQTRPSGCCRAACVAGLDLCLCWLAKRCRLRV